MERFCGESQRMAFAKELLGEIFSNFTIIACMHTLGLRCQLVVGEILAQR